MELVKRDEQRMSKNRRQLISALGGVAVLLLMIHTALAKENDQGSSLYVTPAMLKEWQQQGREIVFLDVREADEFSAGHLPGAVNIHYTEVPGMAGTLPKDRPIVTYCIHSARRAPEAAKTLRKLGFTNAYVLEGGIVAWQAGGLSLRANTARAPKILPYSDRCADGKKQG